MQTSKWIVMAMLALGLAACGGSDRDGDGVDDATDNCPSDANADQKDSNGNGKGDACETAAADGDGDGVADATDNCRTTKNANQADGDHDGVGDACDNCPGIANQDQADADHDGKGDACAPANTPGCANAAPLGPQGEQGAFSDPLTDKFYYTFDGNQGDLLAILTDAKPDSDEFSDAYPDLVVTLYDATGAHQLARNDDPTDRTTNDSFLLTMLPATGTYCVEVAECNAVFGSANCSDPAKIENKDFVVAVSALNEGVEVRETEPNDAAGSATALTFDKDETGKYGLRIASGTFSAASDKDVFKFTIPADVPHTGTRVLVHFEGDDKTGPNGNGSTADHVRVRLAAAAAPNDTIALADLDAGQSGSVPVEGGSEYILEVSRTGGTAGANDFYLLSMSVSGGNPLESEPNDSLEQAGALTKSTSGYFVEGDLTATDSDFFSVTPAAGDQKISVVCAAQGNGSGLRGLKFELLGGDGASLGTASETAEAPAFVNQAAIPAGTSQIIVKITAASQAADVSSSFYRCGVRLVASGG